MITAAEVTRNEEGYWIHPALEHYEGEVIYRDIPELAGMTLTAIYGDEDDPILADYWDNGDTDISAWTCHAKIDGGWFLIAIDDSEDGPYALYARAKQDEIRRQIRFVDSLVPAVQSGQKPLTRRVIEPQPTVTEEYLRKHGAWHEGETLSQHVNAAWQAGFINVECSHGQVGELVELASQDGTPVADAQIVSVRIEQLQDITEADAEAEGVAFLRHLPDADETLTPIQLFQCLWDGIYADRTNRCWDANPWVWVIEFKRIEGPA